MQGAGGVPAWPASASEEDRVQSGEVERGSAAAAVCARASGVGRLGRTRVHEERRFRGWTWTSGSRMLRVAITCLRMSSRCFVNMWVSIFSRLPRLLVPMSFHSRASLFDFLAATLDSSVMSLSCDFASVVILGERDSSRRVQRTTCEQSRDCLRRYSWAISRLDEAFPNWRPCTQHELHFYGMRLLFHRFRCKPYF